MNMPHLYLIEFAKQHPGALLATCGVFIAVISYLLKRSIDEQGATNKSLREDLNELMRVHSGDMDAMRDGLMLMERKTDERLAQLSSLLIEQFGKLSSAMAAQNERLAKLEGEHHVMAVQHSFAMRRRVDRAEVTHDPENGEGD